MNSCIVSKKNNFIEQIKGKFVTASTNDENSKLGTYMMINPTLSKPNYERKLEFQRVIITRYRTGSHNLRIEKDRKIPNSNREDRICLCNTGVQTIKHVLLDCPLLTECREKHNIIDMVNGIHNDDFLLEMECILNIR